MGIRYERTSGKATNGPLIFFSLIRDEAFEEEIRSAYYNGLSFYAYREPGDSMFTYGSSEGYVETLGIPGFSIGFFDPSKPFITIPYAGIKKGTTHESLYKMPQHSTPFSDYRNEVYNIIENLKGNSESKVVASRVIVKEIEIDIADKFYELCEEYPQAYVFCFSTPATGCWIGASPELLLEGKESKLISMALAGTRKTADNEDEVWDKKNVIEQKIVTDYIARTFKEFNLNPQIETTFTKKAGNVEHICTPISAHIPSEFNLENFIKSLAPTPALCGFPKAFALEEINRLENFDRGCYGGFCGAFHSINDFSFKVVLRCAAVNQKRYCVYVGGGVTSDSDINKEWEETEYKIPYPFR